MFSLFFNVFPARLPIWFAAMTKRNKLEDIELPPTKKKCLNSIITVGIIYIQSLFHVFILFQNPIKLYKKAKAKLRNDSSELIGRNKEREQIKDFWEVTDKKKKQKHWDSYFYFYKYFRKV